MFLAKSEKAFWEQSNDGSGLCAMVGNAHVGKATLLENLLKRNLREESYPGSSFKLSGGQIPGTESFLVDLPGSFLFSGTEEETLTRQVLFEKNIEKLVLVADAKDLASSLTQFFYFREFDLPMMLNVNMTDEAALHGLEIDADRLSEMLGCPVNTSIAIDNVGVQKLQESLKNDLNRPKPIQYPAEIEQYLSTFESLVPMGLKFKKPLALSLLMKDSFAMDHLKKECAPVIVEQVQYLIENTKKVFSKSPSIILHELFLEYSSSIVQETVSSLPLEKPLFMDKLGRWSRNVGTGIPIALMVLTALFYIVGKFGAEFLVGLMEGELFGEVINPYVEAKLSALNWPFFQEMVVGEFGLLTVGITLPLGLVLPVLVTFYLCFNFLEASGYLPRLAILFDRIFKKMGMSGKGVIPLLMGFSCITMAILTTRVLDTKKEKNIATLLLTMGIPCAPLFGIMLILLVQMPISASFVLFGILITQIMVIGFIVNKIFKGRQSNFVFSIPPLQIPKMKRVVTRAFAQSWDFLKEALPVFLYATFFVFLLDHFGGIEYLKSVSKPILSDFIGLPQESVSVFLMSMIRREAGVALLKQFTDANLFTNVQIVINLLLVTFLIPCVNAILVIVKERGWKVAVGIAAFAISYAICMGGILNFTFTKLGVTF